MKGIILAGGQGTRLYPITKVVNKQLLPIIDKPLIYYSMSILLLTGVKDILIITRPEDQWLYKQLFGNGEKYGVSFFYVSQDKPRGISDAFILGKDFLKGDDCCLVLGDNILVGSNISTLLGKSKNFLSENNAVIHGVKVKNPKDFGVIKANRQNEVVSIEEKPENPQSDVAAIGLYFFPGDVVEKVKQVKNSIRGELEITSLIEIYMKENRLKLNRINRGSVWIDAGTPKAMLEASNIISTLQEQQNQAIANLDEIAYHMGNISAGDLKKNLDFYPSACEYKKYLEEFLSEIEE